MPYGIVKKLSHQEICVYRLCRVFYKSIRKSYDLLRCVFAL